MMEILQKFGHTSRIGVALELVKHSFSTRFRLCMETMQYHIELSPGGQGNSGRVWRASKIILILIQKENKTIKTAEAKFQKLISTDAGYTIRELAIATGISISKVHFILNKLLHARKMPARWISHLLSDDQKRARVTYAIKF